MTKDEQSKQEQVVANEAARELSRLGASKGGKARAESLTPEERSEIARNAVNARWQKAGKVQSVLRATHEAPLHIKAPDGTSFIDIDCAVLEDKTRVLSERAFSRALGSKRGGSHWVRQRKLPDGAKLPVYLSADRLKPLIPQDLALALSEPIVYSGVKGGRANGINAIWIPKICEVWLEARRQGLLTARMDHIATQAEILMRGFATIGIIALIDEATGYQTDRAREELAEILRMFISDELRRWVKTFPAAYFKELCRLKGIEYRADMKLPKYFGTITNDVVYKRLAPGILEQLKRMNPRDNSGRRKHKHFQWLTNDIGHPKLVQHLGLVVGVMRLSDDFDDFKVKLDRAAPIIVDLPLFGVMSDDL